MTIDDSPDPFDGLALKMGGMPPKALPTTARGLRTRASLVAAARVVFERDGFLNARLTDMTAEAKCSIGTFYTYFNSKEEIFLAVMESSQEDMLSPELPRLEEGASPERIIEAIIRGHLEAYQRNVKLMALLEQVSTIDPHFAEYRRRRRLPFFERHAALIQDLQERGLADPELDPMTASASLSTMIGRMAYSNFVMGDDYPVDLLVATLTRLWLNGLGLPHEEGTSTAKRASTDRRPRVRVAKT